VGELFVMRLAVLKESARTKDRRQKRNGRRQKTEMRVRTAFLLLIGAQAAHSLEEYFFRLFDVWAPARAVSGLFSDDLSLGFAVANALVILLGAACYLASIRPGRRSATGLAWFWAIVETLNGVGHTILALGQQGYFPGVATAPLLLGAAGYLMSLLVKASTLEVGRR
jgi:hypothetical protein